MDRSSSGDAGPTIRVLLVEDSPLSVAIIRRMLASAAEIEIVGVAGNGIEALEMLPRVRPHVVCTDLHMPGMDGLTLTREIMARCPLPILVLSVSVQAGQEHNIFRMLDAGAVDIMAKPLGGLADGFSATARDLVTRIKILAGVKVIGKHRNAGDAAANPLPSAPIRLPAGSPPRIIGIGASTGGPQALETILRHLPENFPIPLICVQHIAGGFMQGLVDWLAASSRIRVCLAEDGMVPQPRTAYFARDDQHLECDAAGILRNSGARMHGGHRPSIDIALGSLARAHGRAAVGVLLTGMGVDGAHGMLEIARAGGVTIAQDESSSVVFGMPRRAIELGAAHHVLPLPGIGPALADLLPARDRPPSPSGWPRPVRTERGNPD